MILIILVLVSQAKVLRDLDFAQVWVQTYVWYDFNVDLG